MATMNPFDILGDDDTEDLTKLISKPVAAQQPAAKVAQPPAAKPAAKLPTKPLPPTQAVREAKNEAPRGGARGGGRGAGRGRGGGRGYSRDSGDNDNSFGRSNVYSGGYRATEEGESGTAGDKREFRGPPGGFRVGRRGGFSNGDSVEGGRPRRGLERRSGTGRGNEIKRDGAGRGNWGTSTDENALETEEPAKEGEKVVDNEKPVQDDVGDANKEGPANEPEEKEPEDKEMTLEEYEKVLEEKRKALLSLKPEAEERKVDLDKEFKSMQILSNKKNDEDIFVKLGSDKDKRKEVTEKAKKSVSINEFLKPAEREAAFYRPGGRGRGRGRGAGSGWGGNYGNNYPVEAQAPLIQDVDQFPSLGGK